MIMNGVILKNNLERRDSAKLAATRLYEMGVENPQAVSLAQLDTGSMLILITTRSRPQSTRERTGNQAGEGKRATVLLRKQIMKKLRSLSGVYPADGDARPLKPLLLNAEKRPKAVLIQAGFSVMEKE